MMLFVFAALYFSVCCFGGVHYWVIAASHLLVLGGMLVYVIASIRREKISLVPSTIYLPLVAGLIAALAYLYYSPAYFYARKEFLIFSCAGIAFFITVQRIDSARSVRRAACGMASAACLVACYGIYQYYVSPDKTYAVLKPAEYWGRASGTFISPNHFGDLLAVSVPILVGFLLSALVTPRGHPPWKQYLQIVGIGAGLAALLSALLLSFSRGSITACIIAMCVMFFFAVRSPAARRSAWICMIVVGVLAAGSFLQQAEPVRSAEKIAAGDQARLAVARDSLRMIKDAPVTGHGAGMYRWVFPSYKGAGIRRVVDYAHNDYLHIAAETGVIGTSILLIALILLYRQGICAAVASQSGVQLLAAGLTGGLTAGLLHAFVDFNLHMPANVLYLAVIAGSIVASCRITALGSRRLEISLKGDVAKVISWIIAFVIFLWMVADVRLIGAAFFYDQGEKQTARLQWDEAVTACRKAFHLDPANPVIAGKIAELNYKKYIFARAERDLLRDEALAWYTMAVSLNPYDGELRVRLADLYQNIGERDKAEQQLRAALRLDPHNGFFHLALGKYYLKSKEYLKAIPEFEETLRIYPKDDIAQALLKRAKKQLSDAGHQLSEEKK